MKKLLTPIIVGALALSAFPAIAQNAPAEQAEEQVDISKGKLIFSSDGKRLGRIYKVKDDGDVQILINSKIITISAATISMVDGKLQTSLTRDEVI